jgi:hypothetical protein
LNFLLAALLMGFGPFAGLYLDDQGWMPATVGLVRCDPGSCRRAHRHDQVKARAGRRRIAAVTVGILILELRPDFPSVFAAAVMQGMAGSVIGPGIAVISLGLVGHDALAGRLGRNQQLASIGGLTAAGTMGVVGYLLSTREIFLLTAALGLPVLLVLGRIRASDLFRPLLQCW